MYTKIIQSGSLLEVFEYEKTPHVVRRVSQKRRRGKRFPANKARRWDNIARCRKNFIRLVSSNLSGKNPPSFFTFTFVECKSVEVAFREWSCFWVRMRKMFGAKLKFIVVPEFQKRGDVHFHSLIWGLDDDIVNNERSHRSIQNIWSYGYVDGISTDGNVALAGYMGKYMSKAMHDERLMGKKAYSASRGLVRPVSVSSETPSVEFLELLGFGKEKPEYTKEFNTDWLGRAVYSVYS